MRLPYQSQIAGILSCYDRIIIQGTVSQWGYASAMTEYLYVHHIRIFDYPRWAQPLRDAIRENAEWLAKQNQIAHQPRLLAPLLQNLLNPIFLPTALSAAEELDFSNEPETVRKIKALAYVPI